MTTDQKLEQAAFEVLELAQKWERDGVIVAIDRLPLSPLAMGNHIPSVHVWRKRECATVAVPVKVAA